MFCFGTLPIGCCPAELVLSTSGPVTLHFYFHCDVFKLLSVILTWYCYALLWALVVKDVLVHIIWKLIIYQNDQFLFLGEKALCMRISWKISLLVGTPCDLWKISCVCLSHLCSVESMKLKSNQLQRNWKLTSLATEALCRGNADLRSKWCF